MKKLVFVVLCLLLITHADGQSNDASMRISDRFKRSSLLDYKKDLDQFEKMTLGEISEPSTLYNYYFSILHANYFDKNSMEVKDNLIKVFEQLKSVDPNCYEAQFIEYFQNKESFDAYESLLSAYNLEPNNADLLDDMMAYYLITGNQKKVKEMALKIKNSGKYTQEIYNYQRNVLASTTDNAMIVTNGELDTYPLLVLLLTEAQERSIVVVNFNLLNHANYRNNVLNQIGISSNIEHSNLTKFMESLDKKHLNYKMYVTLTCPKRTLKSLKKKLFLTGLTFQYSSQTIDNVITCYNNYVNHFDMHYLWNKKLLDAEVNDLNRNYIPMLNVINTHAVSATPEQKQEIQSYINQLKK